MAYTQLRWFYEPPEELTPTSIVDVSPVPGRHAQESERTRAWAKGLAGRRARPGTGAAAEVCVVLLLPVTKQAKALSGSALDYKQQAPFLAQGEPITCSHHFPKYLEVALSSAFTSDFAQHVSVFA